MRRKRPQSLLEKFHAWERQTDGIDFQWRARLQQSIWRTDQNLEPAQDSGKKRGARIPMPQAKESLANYLTENIRKVVRFEVEDPMQSKGKLYGKPRIYDNLLSSQPLCFNLFAELSLNMDLAQAVFHEFSQGRIHSLEGIEFEYSPGRGDPKYTGDRSAFDVYIRYKTQNGGKGFVGVEVKYHEGLKDKEAAHRHRYDELSEQLGWFKKNKMDLIRKKPLQQIWRDHLLVGAHRLVDNFEDGFFVFLHPAANSACANAVKDYAECLCEPSSFESWTLEGLVNTLKKHSSEPWVDAFYQRYLNFDTLDALVKDS